MSKRSKTQRVGRNTHKKVQSKKGPRFKGFKLFLLSIVSVVLCGSFLLLPRNWNWFVSNPYAYVRQIPTELKNRDPDHRKELRFGYSYLFAKHLSDIVPKGKSILMPPQALLIYNYAVGKSLNEMDFDFIDFSLDLLMLHHIQDYTFLHMDMDESMIRTADYALTAGTRDQPVQLIEIKNEEILNRVLARYKPYLDFPTKNWTKEEMYDLVQQLN